MQNPRIGLLLGTLGLLALSSTGLARGAGGYHVVNRWKPGGEGGWDLLTVDERAHRLYYGRGDRVQVIDLGSGRLVGEIPDTPGIHGVAIAPEAGRGFTSNGRDSSVTIFDLASLRTIARVRLDAQNPDAILYEPHTKRVFSFNGRSRDATAIDAATGAVLGTISFDGKPELAVADGKGRIYVNLEDSSAVVGFDAASLAITSRWPLAPGVEPTGIALDAVHHRLFSTCSNSKMIVLDTTSGRVVADLPIGAGVDGAAFDPATGMAFSSNGEGTITVLHEDSPDRFRVVATVPTQRSARTLALEPRTHRLYLAAAEFGEAPAATPDHPHPRAPMIPGSFMILEVAR